MQYQSFPGVQGASQSFQKLEALRLPRLSGRNFLDVGCNEGFFCGYARFDGASRVVGIDYSKGAITRARQKFPDCEFLNRSWNELPPGPFDVILLASALHYADDQENLIKELMSRLSDDGTLVLEVGVAPSAKSEWVKVKRSIDERLFPSWKKLDEVLADYAWKSIGFSVDQAGDPLRRYVLHIRRKKPCVYLLLEPPASGKTTLGKNLFAKAGIPVISGDRLYFEVSKKTIRTDERLAELVSEKFSHTDIAGLTEEVFARGLAQELVGLWCAQVGYADFALDSFVPEKHHRLVRELLFDKGYIPVTLSWLMDKSIPAPEEACRKAKKYYDYLSEKAPGDGGSTVSVRAAGGKTLLPWVGKWHLDYPCDGQPLSENEPLRIAGWALPAAEWSGKVRLYLKTSAGREIRDFNRQRPDVVAAVCRGADGAADLLTCGFDFSIAAEDLHRGAELGFLVGEGEEVPAATLSAGARRRKERRGRLLDRVNGIFRRVGGKKG